MARSISLANLRARVRAAGDFGPDTTSGRYPNTRLNTQINQSWQRQREIATTKGDGQIYLTHTVAANMTPGTVDSVTSFGTIPWPTGAVSIHGVDVVFSANDIHPLESVSFADRNTFRDVYGGPTGRPLGFAVINVGFESLQFDQAGTIAIFPAPDRSYPYTVWYLPVWTDITNDIYVFDGVAGWDDFTVWDSVIQIAAGDNDAQQVVQIAMAERAKAEELISARVNSIQRVGPTRRRDVAGQSRRTRQTFWRRPA